MLTAEEVKSRLPKHFWKNINFGTPNDCWDWKKPFTGSGYGIYSDWEKTRAAHRFMYLKLFGGIPPGIFICHHCDRPQCVNPSHLFAGTAKDNRDDMVRKGRNKSPIKQGEEHLFAKLNNRKVRMIRFRIEIGESIKSIADRYSVCKATVKHIKSGRSWKHVV